MPKWKKEQRTARSERTRIKRRTDVKRRERKKRECKYKQSAWNSIRCWNSRVKRRTWINNLVRSLRQVKLIHRFCYHSNIIKSASSSAHTHPPYGWNRMIPSTLWELKSSNVQCFCRFCRRRRCCRFCSFSDGKSRAWWWCYVLYKKHSNCDVERKQKQKQHKKKQRTVHILHFSEDFAAQQRTQTFNPIQHFFSSMFRIFLLCFCLCFTLTALVVALFFLISHTFLY